MSENFNLPAYWYDAGNRKCHVLSIVDDASGDEGPLVAAKWYVPGRERWEYKLVPLYLVQHEISMRAERDGEPLDAPPAPITDQARMDWLVGKAVEVRKPAVYGSFELFHAQSVSDADEPYATSLRQQIDQAMREGK